MIKTYELGKFADSHVADLCFRSLNQFPPLLLRTLLKHLTPDVDGINSFVFSKRMYSLVLPFTGLMNTSLSADQILQVRLL